MSKSIKVSFNERMKYFRRVFEIKKLKKDMHPYWMSYQKKRFRQSYLPAYRKCSQRKPLAQIVYELVYLTLHWHCIPYHYFRYELYTKGLTKLDLLDYLPETVFYYKILPKINRNYSVLDDKFITTDMLSANGIPVPKTIFKVINGVVFDDKSEIIDNDVSFQVFLKKQNYQCIIAKFASCGSGGKQVIVISKAIDGFYIDGQRLVYREVVTKYNNWLFQERLFNVPFLSEIHPTSLNTFRIMTYFSNGKADILYSMLKFGNDNTFTDNAHTNGVYIKVNAETQTTGGFAYDENMNMFTTHPITNKKLAGIYIDGFDKVLATANKAAVIFSENAFVGFDIAMTTNGVVVLEGNSSPGLTIIQRTHSGMKEFIGRIL